MPCIRSIKGPESWQLKHFPAAAVAKNNVQRGIHIYRAWSTESPTHQTFEYALAGSDVALDGISFTTNPLSFAQPQFTAEMRLKDLNASVTNQQPLLGNRLLRSGVPSRDIVLPFPISLFGVLAGMLFYFSRGLRSIG